MRCPAWLRPTGQCRSRADLVDCKRQTSRKYLQIPGFACAYVVQAEAVEHALVCANGPLNLSLPEDLNLRVV